MPLTVVELLSAGTYVLPALGIGATSLIWSSLRSVGPVCNIHNGFLKHSQLLSATLSKQTSNPRTFARRCFDAILSPKVTIVIDSLGRSTAHSLLWPWFVPSVQMTVVAWAHDANAGYQLKHFVPRFQHSRWS